MNWEERLSRPLTLEDAELSQSWETCAVGELFPNAPNICMQPENETLDEMGHIFHEHVHAAVHDKMNEKKHRDRARLIYRYLKDLKARGLN